MHEFKLYELYDRRDIYTDVAESLIECKAPQERIDQVLRKVQELEAAIKHAEEIADATTHRIGTVR